MNRQFDDDAQFTRLLQALSTPPPSGEFLAGARRRYVEAMEARDCRTACAGLAAALVGLGAIIALLATIIEPAALVAWLAEATVDLARWAAGLAVVTALVPASIWISTVLGATATVLSLTLLARAKSLSLVK